MVRRPPFGLILALVTAVACNNMDSKPNTRAGSVPKTSSYAPIPKGLAQSGVMVRISKPSGDSIVATTGTIQSILDSQLIDGRTAVDRWVNETLLADHVTETDGTDAIEVRTRIAEILARGLLKQITESARAEGPIRDDEIVAALGTEGWIDHDLPETRVVAHTLVKKGTPDAMEIAVRLREAVVDAPLEQFSVKARAVKAPDGAILTEALPLPFTRDGRIAAHGQAGTTFDVQFAEGAFLINKVGDTSGIVQSGYGLHVIRLIQIRPAFQTTRADRVFALEPEVIRARVGSKFANLLTSSKNRLGTTMLATDADLLLPHVSTARLGARASVNGSPR